MTIDRLSQQQRSRNMARIRARDTKPELKVRSLLHRMGYRFRLCRKDLPGTPDIVLPRHHTVILVHGCFWHRHSGCKYSYTPRSRIEFWRSKFEANIRRDAEVRKHLQNLGWKVVTVWECQTKDEARLSSILKQKLSASTE